MKQINAMVGHDIDHTFCRYDLYRNGFYGMVGTEQGRGTTRRSGLVTEPRHVVNRLLPHSPGI